MIFKDYYKILGLETNKVSMEDVKNAFREQAKKYHPDVNKQTKGTEERFKDINEAYRVLSDSASKRKYDRIWHSRVGRKKQKSENEKNKQEPGSTVSEFFNMFFGEPQKSTEKTIQKKSPTKGENIETEINVKLDDAYFGLEKKISLRAVNRKNENIFSKSTIRN